MSSNTFEKACREKIQKLREEDAQRSDEERQRQAKIAAEHLSQFGKPKKTAAETGDKLH